MLILLLLVTVLTPSLAQDNQTVEYYVNLLTEAYINAYTYTFPQDASQYRAESNFKNYGVYDFVIIGGGAGGSVSANRLSEIGGWSVLLIEAGGYGNNLTDVPGAFVPATYTDHNWGFNSTPQTTACLGMSDQVCNFPRGRGLGGSSLINAMIQSRGYQYDYDTWAEMVDNERWNYETVLNYMKKSENYVHNDQEAPYEPLFHGVGGELRVEYPQPRKSLTETFFQANQELGYQIVDYNANKLGAGPTQQYTKNGHRVDDYEAFLHPIRHRKNLEILTRSYVTKIRINKRTKRAVGVEFSSNGTNYYVKAKKEVILSAGAINSPQILMLSGVGPKNHLKSLGIDVIEDLAVGENLRDHACFFGLSLSSNFTEPAKPLRDQVIEFLRDGEGPLTTVVPALGFYESNLTRSSGVPEIELLFIPPRFVDPLMQRFFMLTGQTYEDVFGSNDVSNTLLIDIVDLHARSHGTVRLKSSNPYDYPLIDPRWLSDPDDVDITTLYEGVQLVLNLINTEAFRAVDAKLQTRPLRACSDHEYLSKEYWFCALRQVTVTLYHPSGSCSMGTDPKKGAVVDSELKVFGIENLRVADISVMPMTHAGHTHAPALMVGEQLGDLVKETYSNQIAVDLSLNN